jgi:hypothetical protein
MAAVGGEAAVTGESRDLRLWPSLDASLPRHNHPLQPCRLHPWPSQTGSEWSGLSFTGGNGKCTDSGADHSGNFVPYVLEEPVVVVELGIVK